MKAGTVGLSTNGAIVRLRDSRVMRINVVTRLTGGSVVELEIDTYYAYQFNVAGDGRFTLAVRPDGGDVDLESTAFESAEAKQGAHGDRSFAFKVPT